MILERNKNLKTLNQLIGATVRAISESYNHTTAASLDYIKNAMEDEENSKKITINAAGQKFSYSLLSLFPPPVLTIKEATVTIKTAIIDLDEEDNILTKDNKEDNNASITFKLTNEDSTAAFATFLQNLKSDK